MFRLYKRLLYRDRRRLAISALMFFAATTIGFDFIPDPVSFIPSEALILFALLAAMPAVTLRYPKRRFLIEVIALSNLSFVLLGRLLPMSHFNLTNPSINWGSAIVLYVFTIVVVNVLFTGEWSDRFLRLRLSKSSAHTQTALDRRRLWFGLVPTPGHIDECPDPEIVSIDFADTQRRKIRVISWMPPRARTQAILNIHQIDPLTFVRFQIEYHDDDAPVTSNGVTAFRITAHPDALCKKVEITHDLRDVPLRLALRAWLDDTVGRILDQRVANIERLASTTKRKRAAGPSTVQMLDDYGLKQPLRSPDRRRSTALAQAGGDLA